jgi:hypothetical protein
MQINTQRSPIFTHEGTKAKRVNPTLELRRSVMACLLWEGQFYENGVEIANRIASLVPKVEPEQVFDIAVEAREKMKLRHVPLLIARECARAKGEEHREMVADLLERIIQRPDELAEFLAIYWKDKRQPLAAQVKRGLRAAFNKFDDYQLAKYNRADKAVTLRDVMFLTHPKPESEERAAAWKALADRELASPDTWEVALSGGADKGETFTRLLKENKLGALALLRNLRNMEQAGVDPAVIREGLRKMKVNRVLPFRFITAAKHAVKWEPELEAAMFQSVAGKEKLAGTTAILVDVSYSMVAPLSKKSTFTRMDAACGVAMIARELCESARIFSFSNGLVECPPRRGFALRDAIVGSQEHSGTDLGGAVTYINSLEGVDRLVVFTDEQSHTRVPDPVAKRAYMVNVASYKNGVGYGKWTHVDGWSEAILDYIQAFEVPSGPPSG